MLRLLFTVVLISFLMSKNVLAETRCRTDNVVSKQCGENEMCVSSNNKTGSDGYCRCLVGYKLLDGVCLKEVYDSKRDASSERVDRPPENSNGGRVAVAVLVPLFLVVLVIGAGFVIARKTNLIAWVRNKLDQRQAPYDEVMIGQDDDDPPLSGV